MKYFLMYAPLHALFVIGISGADWSSNTVQLCANVTCPISAIENTSEGVSCTNCSQCHHQSYGFCIQVTNIEIEGSSACLCKHDIPSDCLLQNQNVNSSENDTIPLYTACYRNVSLRALPALEPFSENDTAWLIKLPMLPKQKYWKPLVPKIKSFDDLLVQVFFNTTDNNYPCPANAQISSRVGFSCWKSVKFLDHPFAPVSTGYEVIQIRKSQLAPDIIEANADIGIVYRARIQRMKLFLNGRRFRISTVETVNESSLLLIQRLTESQPEDIVKGLPPSSSDAAPIAVVVFVAVLAAVIVAVVLVLRKKRLWPFAPAPPKYSYCEYEVRNGALGLNRPFQAGLSAGGQASLLLDNSPEIAEFRELLAQCPMLIPPKLDIKEAIGNGRFGLIRKGIVLDTRQEIMAHCAISPYRQNMTEVKDFLVQFEAAAKSGQHPNIMSLVGACDQDERLLICVESIGGPNLQTLLRESRTLDHFMEYAETHKIATLMSAKRLFNIMLGVTRGFCHLQARQVLHPHLAAVNVLIGEGGTPKIAGFGFATLADLYSRDTEKKHSITRWLAPEVISSKRQALASSQTWSFGVVLWEIMSLAGTPYSELATNDVKRLVDAGEILPAKPDYCDDRLYDLMRRCWRHDALDRLQGMEALRELQDLALHPEEHVDLNMKDGRFDYIPIRPALEED